MAAPILLTASTTPMVPAIPIRTRRFTWFLLNNAFATGEPHMENMIFWIAALTGLAAALFAYLRREHIGQLAMFCVYLTTAAAILIAAVSIGAATDAGPLTESSLESIGLLIGCLLGFGITAIIAGRLSARFPLAFVWFGMTAAVAPYTGLNTYLALGSGKFWAFALGAKAFGCLVAFLLYCRYRRDLTQNQSLAVIALLYCSMAAMFLGLPRVPKTAQALAVFVLLLLGLLPMASGLADNRMKRILAVIMMAPMVFTIFIRLNLVTSWSPYFFSVLAFALLIFAIAWLRYQRAALPMTVYAFSILFLTFLVCLVVLPSEWYTDYLLAAAAISMIIAAVACWWHGIAAYWQFTRQNLLRGVLTMCCAAVLAIGVPFCLNIPLALLSTELGPTRRLVQLHDTIFWPGDATFMRLALADEYFWASEAKPFAPLKKSATADAVLESGIAQQDKYSFLDTKQEMENLQHGITDSAGIGIMWPKNDIPVVLYVTKSSVAAKNGLQRGDRILAMNGRMARDREKEPSWLNMVRKGQLITLTVRSVDGRTRRIVAQRQKTEEDVPFGSLFRMSSGKVVGYLYIQEFQAPQVESVEPIFEMFQKAHIQDLIIDLRYNPGGNVYAAAKLASLIAGAGHDGELFVRSEYPWRYHRKDKDIMLSREPLSLDIKNLIVITTDDTASASENLIIGLKPYMHVITVGGKTFGKPYAMDPIHFGDKELLLITSRLYNANGESWPATGIRADVAAKDDLTHQLGDEEEEMLLVALRTADRL